MTIKIEKGVPMPPMLSSRSNPKYPWKDMEIGDSFFAPLSSYECRSGEPTIEKFAATMHRCATAQKVGKFSVRKQDDGMRVWRVA